MGRQWLIRRKTKLLTVTLEEVLCGYSEESLNNDLDIQIRKYLMDTGLKREDVEIFEEKSLDKTVYYIAQKRKDPRIINSMPEVEYIPNGDTMPGSDLPREFYKKKEVITSVTLEFSSTPSGIRCEYTTSVVIPIITNAEDAKEAARRIQEEVGRILTAYSGLKIE